MGKLQTEVGPNALVVNKLSRLGEEKGQKIKSWEEQCTKDAASHDNEVKRLDSQLVGKKYFTYDQFC